MNASHFIWLESALLTAALTPIVGRLAGKWRLLDLPDARKVHRKPIPRVGGIGILIGVLVAIAPWLLHAPDRTLVTLVATSFGVFLVGLLDDVVNLPGIVKLVALVAASVALHFGGIQIDSINISSWYTLKIGLASLPLTMIWIVGITVAINFIDGLDGLAAGIAAVTSATIAVIAATSGQASIAILSFAVMGSLIGFLVFNRHPARIFMGDCGSLFIGFVIAASSVASTQRVRTLALALPMLVLGVPLFDVVLTMIRRGILQRRSLFAAERGHVHHRLMDLGIKHGRVVFYLHSITLLSGIVAIVIWFRGNRALTIGLSAAIAVLLFSVFTTVGSLSPRQIVGALKHNLELYRSTRRYRKTLDDLQLKFDRAKTFDDWWQLICDAAVLLSFTHISLETKNRDGTMRRMEWRRPNHETALGTGLAFAVPTEQRRVGEVLRLVGEADASKSTEDAGKRVSCFVRLMDQHGLASIESSQLAANATPRKAQEVIGNGIKRITPALVGTGTKIAIVHDFLYVYAGAEKVLEQLVAIFPTADIFSLFDFLPPENRGFIRNKPVRTSFIQRLPFARTRHRMYLPLMPMAIEQFDMSNYDLIVSSSYIAAKGVITGPDQLHISYCHSPIRFAWDLQHEYFAGAKMTGLKSVLARMVLHYIRTWDARSSGHVDRFVTNSRFVARRIAKCYRRRADAIYPPVDVDAFELECEKEDFYLTASRLVPYKRIDLIVEAFAKTPKRRLIVVGDGPEYRKIKAIAPPNVRVLGHVPFEKLKSYMQKARAFVFAAEEDFGIVVVEAQSCGTPVIAFGYGGAVETVVNGETGVLFPEQTVESILEAVKTFESRQWDPATIRANAERFSVARFRDEFRSLVEREWNAFVAAQAESRQSSSPNEVTARKLAGEIYDASRNGNDLPDFDTDEAGAVAH